MYRSGHSTENRYLRLMVVEGDPGDGYAVSHWLSGQGVRSVLAGSAAEAVEMLRDVIFIESAFDGLLVDCNRPDSAGFRMIEEFRDEFPSVPVALMSGSDDVELQRWARQRNIPLFEKPLNLTELQGWLEALKQIA